MFSEAVEAERATVGRFTVRVIQDSDPESPREWCNVGTFWTSHSDYNSPDKYKGDLWDALAVEFDVRDTTARDFNGRFIDRENQEYSTDRDKIMRAVDRDSVWLWVWIYDHSGVSYAAGAGNPFSCRWDSGRVGLIFAKRDKCRAEWGRRYTAKALSYLAGEVKDYSDWASGNAWGYVIEDETGTEVDSCWGWIGDTADCLSEGKAAAEYLEAESRDTDAQAMADSIAAARPDLAPIWEGARA